MGAANVPVIQLEWQTMRYGIDKVTNLFFSFRSTYMKVRISIVVLLVALIGVFSTTVMAQDVAREDTVIFDIDGAEGSIANFDNFNNMLPDNRGNAGMGQAVREPLFILNYETGEIQPWLAESFVPNDEQTVWTLNLREGAKWADGEAFDADDVVFTIELRLNDETQALGGAADMQQWVESVEKIDDYTVEFTLSSPNPRFQLDYFSVRIGGSPYMLPEHVWNDKDPFTFKDYDPEQGWPLGTGPYTLTSASETEFVYDRNDDWWGAETGVFKLPEPLRLIWVVTGNDQIRSTLAVDNELDSVMDVTRGAYEAMADQNENIIAWETDLPYVWLDPCPRRISLNHTVAPWDDPEMRQMLNMVLDREQIVEIAYEGVTIPSRTFFVEYGGMFPFIDAIEEAGYANSPTADLEGAEAILVAKGYERNGDGLWELDGEVLGLEIQAHEGFIEKRRVTNNFVDQLQRFGIDGSAAIIAGATWNENKAFGNFEATTDWDACGSINEPWASMNRYSTDWWTPIGERAVGGHTISRWQSENSERYSEIVREIGVMPLGDPAIVDMVVEAYGLWYEELVDLATVQATKLIPFNTTYWTNWPTAENNYVHPPTWWQTTHQLLQNITKAS
jgi:peptide/nickel transport system substrate-binding protein